MESPILKQIVKFLQTRKKQKQWMVVFVFMAVIVGFGTVTALKMMGQAMTCKEKVLDCQLALHEHTKGCFDKDKNVVCGYADYAVHKHNDDCYNAEHKLICRLPEVEKHEHTKKCYEKTKTLVCGQEESDGHQHGDGCYQTEKGDLKCKKEEHSHSDGCYDEEGNLVCDAEEHQHDDDCYKWEDVLVCGAKEGEGGHKHTDKCYDVQETLVCGKLELHTHTDKCFEKIDKNGKKEPGNLKIVCGKTELKEHTHTEDAGCLRTVDAAEADVIQEKLDKEAEETQPEVSKDGNEIFTTDMNEETEGEALEGAEGEASEDAAAEGEGVEGEVAEGEGAEGEASEDAAAEGEEPETAGDDEQEDAEAEGEEPQGYEESKTYEGLGYIVTASYNKDANIPEEAKFVAERITEESDEENYKKHEAEYKKSLGSEDATMSALFKLGFYVDGEEVEPASPVMITVQFVDKNGLPEGKPIKVVHFGDDKTEVIDGSKAESGSTSFKTDGFSIFGPDEENEDETVDADSELIPISGDYTYEGDAFDIAFHIEGNATFLNDDISLAGDETISENTSKEPKNEEAGASEGDETEGDKTEASGAFKEDADIDNSGEDVADTEAKDKVVDNENAGENERLEFVAKDLGEESVEYQTFVSYMQDSGKDVDLMQIRTLSYEVTYSGKPLNIEDCDITADIIPKEAMINNTEEDGDGNSIEAFEIKTNSTVNEIEAVPTNNDAQRRVARLNNLSGAPLVASVRSNSNPEFTVQYYAYMHIMEDDPNFNTNAKASIDLIDTSGGNLPTNKLTQNTKNIYVDGTKAVGTWRDIVYKGRERSLEMIYSESPYSLLSYPGLENFDKFATKKNGEGLGEASKAQHHYDTTEVWVLKEGGNPKSKDYADWTIYGKKNAEKEYIDVDVNDVHSLEFTNNPDVESETKILVTDNTVIRLVADINSESYTNDVAFYDYDITDGKVYTDKTLKKEKDRSTLPLYAYTKLQGINDQRNYNGATSSRLGFGMNNTGGTGLQNETTKDGWKINVANGASGVSKVYKNCSFELVSKTLGTDGYPAFSVNAPDLFSSKAQIGKKAVLGRSLEFTRAGDTYTLSKVKNGNKVSADNLDCLQYTGSAWTGKFDMWVNQFWPMDDSEETYNTDGHDLKFGNEADKTNKMRMAVGEREEAFPSSDDGQDHNSYFGMHFSVKFELTEDYVGPLNYYFFGDDDMWVYLDNKLICDIGGCHQAAGEYVNLWDWIKKGDAGTHTLRFFYTERGASGSTCWMQFTLPSVREIPVGKPTGGIKDTLTITKNVEGVATTDKFEFKISLLNESGTPLSNTYPYEIIDSEGNATNHSEGIAHNGTFRLGNGESIVVKDLPDNAKYTIEETNVSGYLSTVGGEVVANGTVEGVIDWYGEDDENLQYVNVSTYELPETGGSGIMRYTIAGALCILLGACFMYTKKARERRV